MRIILGLIYEINTKYDTLVSTVVMENEHYPMPPHIDETINKEWAVVYNPTAQHWYIVTGDGDFRVPYDEGMAAFNAAQLMGVPSRLVIFPGENHWILKPQNALYWHRNYFDWLDRWCKDKVEENPTE